MCLTNKTTLIFVDENYPKNCGAKLSVLKCCCQIVRILLCCYQIVCFFYLGACLPSWCQIVRFYYLGAELSGAKFSGAKLSNHPLFFWQLLEMLLFGIIHFQLYSLRQLISFEHAFSQFWQPRKIWIYLLSNYMFFKICYIFWTPVFPVLYSFDNLERWCRATVES